MAKATSSPKPGKFQGFGLWSLDFYRALAQNQDRTWFHAQRDVYDEQIRQPMTDLFEDLTGRFAELKIPLIGDPKKGLFRPNRDVRFSKNKDPYTTHASGVLSRDGSKKSPGLLYIHISPDSCFLGGGFHLPEPDQLLALREAIFDNPKTFRKIQDKLLADGMTFMVENPFKRVPKGFEEVEDPALIEVLKLRSLVVVQPLAESTIFERSLVDHMIEFTKQVLPLLKFGWSAIDR